MSVSNSFTMSIAQWVLGAIGAVLSWFFMGWWGRRSIYLWGQVGMSAVLFTIGCISFAGRHNEAASWAIGSMLLVYTFVYDATVGPVCYSLVAELLSTRLRTKTVVLARNMFNIAGIATNIMTPRMLNPTAWDWGAKAGFFWAGSCALCAVWTYIRLPEPKRRTYAELDILFERGISERQFKHIKVERLDAGFIAEDIDMKMGPSSNYIEESKQTSSH